MKKLVIVLALATALPFFMQGQSDADALRYSILDFGGTARSLGSANAYGAVGGDFSSLSINPAGLGIYRSSEFEFTPGLATITNKSSFYGTASSDNAYNFNFSNLGFVFNHMHRGRENSSDGWVGGSFAIGYNRLANYNSSTYYTGFNASSSLLDSYTDFLNAGGGTATADAFDKDPFGAGLAWETYLINPNADSVSYYSVVTGGNVQQSKSIVTRGGYNEFTLSFAGNYGNRLYIGATIGIPTIRYKYSSTYTEEDVNNLQPDFQSFSLDEVVNTNGIGINAKFGLIYRINDYVRIGGAVHSPTAFTMSDSYHSSMSSQLDISGDYSYDSPDGNYDYGMITPWRLVGSAALTFKKIGFISLDYEWLDYSQSSFNFDRNGDASDLSYETTVNNNIDTKYTTASNIRLGGELMYDVFRFRAGYAIQGTPFNSGIAAGDQDYSKQTWTAGVGIKDKSFFIDLGYGHTMSKEYDIQYVLADQQNDGASIDKTFNSFLMTFGFRF